MLSCKTCHKTSFKRREKRAVTRTLWLDFNLATDVTSNTGAAEGVARSDGSQEKPRPAE